MISFREWKKLQEVNVNIDPKTIIGPAVKAQQPNNPNNVAMNLATNVPDVALATASIVDSNPAFTKLKDKLKKAANQPITPNVNNVVPPGTVIPGIAPTS